MPQRNAPTNANYRGWFFDQVNNRLEIFFGTTKVAHIDANGLSITNDTTARMTNGVLTVDGAPASGKTTVTLLGSTAAVASNGAGAILSDCVFVAPWNGKIVSAWAENISASDVTKGTATSETSYRRVTLISNTAGTGSGTDIICSLNATASAASLATRAFTTVNSSVPAGAIILASHLTVGAETADGTDMAARKFFIAYQAV